MRKWYREVASALEAVGLSDIQFDQGRKHVKVSGEYEGQRLSCPVGGTPSDRRSLQNTVRDFKRLMRESKERRSQCPKIATL